MENDSSSLQASIASNIQQMLDGCNPYVQTYRQVRDRMAENNFTDLKLRLIGRRGSDGRRYNLPTASEVAALVVGDFDSIDVERDVFVETHSGYLQRVSILNT